MRIWIVHQHAIPPIVMGPTRHFDIAKKWIEQGHEVFILAGNYCHNNFLYIGEPYCLTNKIAYYSNVPFIWFSVPSYTHNSAKRLYNMLVFAYKVCRSKYTQYLSKPDIIIGSSPSPFAALSAQKLAKRFQVPFVYEIRDLWPATLLSLGKFSKKHILVRILQGIENTLLHKAYKIVSVLPGVSDYLHTISKGEMNAKLAYFPNGVDVKAIRYTLPVQRKHCNVVYAGALNISNDLETLLYAAKILQAQRGINFNIQLIGEGPQKSRLIELITSEKLEHVQILPTVRKERIYDLLADADICVGMVKRTNLYQYGTSLNKITDYLAAARPIVFALNSSYSPITEAKAGLTVEPENPAMLAEAILKIASLPHAERIKLGLNGRKYAEQFYNIESISTALMTHLEY